MKFNDNPLMVLLGFFMLLIGASSFFNYRLYPTNYYLIIGVYVLAGLVTLLVFLGKLKANVGMITLAIWLALMGAMSMFNLTYVYSDLLLSILPLASGFFLILGI
jgi:hypothetical protein